MELLGRIEAKWQEAWDKAGVFEADPDTQRRKCFVTFPYSYANGPVHVGHAYTATRVDAFARFKRMQGYNVLFPWAWHWTGTTISGASERVKLGDEEFVRALREIDGVPEKLLQKFADPVFMASYYTKENRKTIKSAGFSIDWRREFQTTSPHFSSFIGWQYKRLREKGYVVKGTHPVVWCPHCESPTGDHDRQEGEGISPEEYTLIKFRYGQAYMPAATFRPETIFGATNLWIHPEAQYVEAEVDDQRWIISETAADKLKAQMHKVSVVRRFKGREVIGRTATSPIAKRQLPILPASFVDPNHGTGVVYSVPAHAPVDWLALKDLRQTLASRRETKIKREVVHGIRPISLIRVEGFGDYPAVEVVEQLGVKDQCDPKADEATKLLYKKEFHSGVLKQTCGKYAGKTVREAKEKIVSDFKKRNVAESMYDLPQPVVCRCLTPCFVKILEGQWFLKYGEKEWKKKTVEALEAAAIYPETAIPWFMSTIDWLKDWPCARKSGLGTPLPWNREWIIETLSDSTIYMAFYTIVKHIRQHKISSKQLAPELFDHIFNSVGDSDEIAEKTGVPKGALHSMQREFRYWYPLDMRISAKELIPNHLTFFLFHHVALFPPKYWPRAIGANGMLMIEGKKMSKSKGNFVTFRSAINRYGADPTRCALLLCAEGMDDPDWRSENVQDIQYKIESFYRLAETIMDEARDEEVHELEKWLLSTLQHRIEGVTKNIEVLKTRTAVENALFGIWNDFRWYARRRGSMKARMTLDALATWVRLLAPFIPHICEELWERMGNKGLISEAEWPECTASLLNPSAEESETLIRSALEDTLAILRATGVTPRKIHYYTAAKWKWAVYRRALEMSLQKAQITQGEIMKALVKDEKMSRIAKEVAEFVTKILDEVNRMRPHRKQVLLAVNEIDEESALRNAADFLKRELKAKIEVFTEGTSNIHDPKQRAKLAKPTRPAIYVE
jgi:leucyl-tRNA synthetase